MDIFSFQRKKYIFNKDIKSTGSLIIENGKKLQSLNKHQLHQLSGEKSRRKFKKFLSISNQL